ncbi:MAG TPA: type II toxin-antitoxin system VapC family toxin [Nitrososphaerales archaeon]|nr:type II toxin-antitoxin system VapC family toxin [Nitrososphaerales archaeon]
MGELEDSVREKEEKEICVDTDILIDFLKGKGPGLPAYKRWRNESSVAITSVTAFELLVGARGSGQREKRYEEARSLIEQQGNVLPFDKSSAEKASEIGAELRQHGKGIEIRDLFNAAICISQGIPLLTKNKEHYQRVTGLKLVPV